MNTRAEQLPALDDVPGHSESLWSKALYKFRRDRTGMWSLGVVLAYMVIAIGVIFGWWATSWAELEGGKWEGPSAEHWFGTNIIGQDIFDRAIYSTRTSFEVGLVVAVLATALGGVLGALAGFFSGSWIDELIIWIMGVLDLKTSANPLTPAVSSTSAILALACSRPTRAETTFSTTCPTVITSWPST